MQLIKIHRIKQKVDCRFRAGLQHLSRLPRSTSASAPAFSDPADFRVRASLQCPGQLRVRVAFCHNRDSDSKVVHLLFDADTELA